MPGTEKQQLATIQPPSCTVTFTSQDELSKNMGENCTAYLENNKVTENHLKTIGDFVPIVAGTGVLLALGVLSFATYQRFKDLKDKVGNKAGTNIVMPTWIDTLKTPSGMMLALLSGTVLSFVIGILLTAWYKSLGISADFAQGSGNMIQAIWGSSVTITAAIVAILLALEAIKTADRTNSLTIESNQLSEYESPAFEILKELNDAKRTIDQYAISIYPIAAMNKGKATAKTLPLFMAVTETLVTSIKKIYNSDLFLMLQNVPLSGLKDTQKESALIRLLEIHLVSPTSNKSNTPIVDLHNCGNLILGEYLWTLKLDMELASLGLEDTEGLNTKIDVMNELGRTCWKTLYTIRNSLEYLDYECIKKYVEDGFTTKTHSQDKATSDLRLTEYGERCSSMQHSRAGDILYQLAIIMQNSN